MTTNTRTNEQESEKPSASSTVQYVGLGYRIISRIVVVLHNTEQYNTAHSESVSSTKSGREKSGHSGMKSLAGTRERI
jgi:hypothetical protein